MTIEGGVFDKIRDDDILMRLCGASWTKNDSAQNLICFLVIGPNDPRAGLDKYAGLNATPGLLDLSPNRKEYGMTCDTAFASSIGKNSFADTPIPGSGETAKNSRGVQAMIDEKHGTRLASYLSGPASSSGPPAPPVIGTDSRGGGVRVLASDLYKDLTDIVEGALGSEQGTPKSEDNVCIKFKKPTPPQDDGKTDRCTSSDDDVFGVALKNNDDKLSLPTERGRKPSHLIQMRNS